MGRRPPGACLELGVHPTKALLGLPQDPANERHEHTGEPLALHVPSPTLIQLLDLMDVLAVEAGDR
jgi:hypothetical protein